MKNEGASLMKCDKPHEKQSVRTSCEHSEHFMTTKLSLYVCNANTSWIEIAITFSEKSKGDTSLPALFHFTCWPKPSTLPHTAAPAVNWLGAPRCLRQMKRCSEQEKTTSIATRSSSSVAPYHSFPPLAKTHSLRTSSSPQNASILGHPPARRLCFWPTGSLISLHLRCMKKWSRFANEVRSNRMKKQEVRFASCEYSEHFITTKLSPHVCGANTSFLEISLY